VKAHRIAIVAGALLVAGSAQLRAQGAQSTPEVFSASELEERPQLVAGSCQAPSYPASLRAARMEGRVLLQFIVDAEGRVEPGSVRTIQSTHSAFDDAARRALLTCRYRPARANQQPVRALVQSPISFRLERG
jgi:TonB family protein